MPFWVLLLFPAAVDSSWHVVGGGGGGVQMDASKGPKLKREMDGWLKRHRQPLTVAGAFLVWLAVGIVFGVTHGSWSFVTSLYYSIAAMSTGGLQV